MKQEKILTTTSAYDTNFLSLASLLVLNGKILVNLMLHVITEKIYSPRDFTIKSTES